MLEPAAMQLFVAVVRFGSFSEAGRRLDLAPSSVSRQINNLEGDLGVQLFIRSTRALTLTESGHVFHERAIRILADLEEARLAVRDFDQHPTGTLRVTAPTVLGRVQVAPAIVSYLQQWPDVSIEIDLTDRLVDLIEQNIDVGIRIGQLPDSNFVARRIGAMHRKVYASPAYLKIHGQPKEPKELTQHNCLSFHLHETSSLWRASATVWRFERNKKSYEISVNGTMRANSADALIQAAVAGLGMILVVDWIVRDQVARGELVPVMTDYITAPSVGDVGVFAVYPAGRHAPAKTRTFVDHLDTWFSKVW